MEGNFQKNILPFEIKGSSSRPLKTQEGFSVVFRIIETDFNLSPIPDSSELGEDIKKLLGYIKDLDRFIKMKIIIDDFKDHSKRREFKKSLDKESYEYFKDNAIAGNNISAAILILSSLYILMGDSGLSKEMKEYLKYLQEELAPEVEKEYRKLYQQQKEASLDNKIKFVLKLKKQLVDVREKLRELVFNNQIR